MKKIIVLAMSALLVTGAVGSAFARDNSLPHGNANFYPRSHGSFNGYHGNRHYSHYRGNCCYGGVYGYDDDNSIAPFIAGGVFGAILGSALNR